MHTYLTVDHKMEQAATKRLFDGIELLVVIIQLFMKTFSKLASFDKPNSAEWDNYHLTDSAIHPRRKHS